MKKFLLLTAAALMFAACEYDDGDLWKAVDDLDSRVETIEDAIKKTNADIAALQSLVKALENAVTITSVDKTERGYVITFSNGETATISDGEDGVDAPVVSVKQDTDGIYYWTLDGRWLTDGQGNKIKAQGTDGAPGQDAVAPQIRINPDTKEWEISLDGGTTWTSTGVVAEGKSGDAIFRSVDTGDENYVTFTLSDGSQIRIPKAVEIAFVIKRKNTPTETFVFGESKTFAVEASGIAEYTLSRPDGWKAVYRDNSLCITAPAAENIYADKEGEIALVAVAANGSSKIFKQPVEAVAGQLRVLSFEDADYNAQANYAGQFSWSSLIDDAQYGGQLLYPKTASLYNWNDANNTYLASELPNSWGDNQFWGGGHAVSDYVDMNLDNGSFTNQLSVYYRNAATGRGGHDGSQNFCIHFGYSDTYKEGALPYFYFIDGVARTVDHMYVMNTTYLLHSVLVGDSFTGGPFAEGDYVKAIAVGFDENGDKIDVVCEFMLAQNADYYVKEWTKWDLSPLGKVTRIEFNMEGSKSGAYGLNTPTYFAYDDVAVRL